MLGSAMASVGESLAANAAGPDGRPAVHHVQGLTLVLPSGQLVRASRRRNAELFALAAGGNGVIGALYSVTLDIASICAALDEAVGAEVLAAPRAACARRALRVFVPPLEVQKFLEDAQALCHEWRMELAGVRLRRTRIEEDTLLRWARLMHQRYGGDRLALGGGVFMNVKANMLLAQEDWVEDLFTFPSCGDESNAVGAAYLGYVDECARRDQTARPEPFGPAYLGTSVTDAETEAVIRDRELRSRYKVAFHDRIEERVAELLVSDGVVARCAGRMEFGARALGNRSILANPTDHRVVGLINRMIKNRDFWMPFAPTVLAERADDYLRNPKGLASPYMMLAMETRPAARDALTAALHPHDATARPQILEQAWNPEYHALIRAFEGRTGVGAVLNTSFNLHGEPIVCTAADAVDTFERSGLQHLAVGHWLISKR